MAISDYYDRTFTAWVESITTDEIGQEVYTYTTSFSFEGIMYNETGNKNQIGGIQRIRGDFRISCPSTITIDENHKLSDTDSRYYDIVFLNKDLRTNHYQIDINLASSNIASE